MKFFDKTLSILGLERKAMTTPLASGIFAGMGFNTGNKISAAKAMSAYNGWTYAAVRAISEEIGNIEFKLYKTTKNGSEEVEQHDLLDLLRAMNPQQTCFDVLFTTAAHLEMTGNSYWLLSGVETEGQLPTAIYNLSPKYTKPIKAPLPEFIKGYRYVVDGVEKDYEPFQVLHFKYADPNDPYEGIGTTQAIAQWIDNDNSATNVNSSYFKNGARLAGLLKSESALTEGQMKLLHTSFEKLYKGEDNQYKVAVLPKGVSYDEQSTSPKDMDFANLSDNLKSKILSGYRVPKTLLGGSESETNRATAEAARAVFLNNVIKPKMEMLCQYLNEFLVPRYGDDLYLDYENPATDDRTQQLEEAKSALAGSASMSINEVRERYFGLGPIEGGDEVMGTFNQVPIGAPIKVAKSTNHTISKGRPAKKFKSIYNKRKSMSDEIAEKIAKNLQEITTKQAEIRSKGLSFYKEMDDKDFETIYKAFATRVTPYEKKMRDVVRKFNKVQKDDVLSAVKGKGMKADLFDLTKYIGLLTDLATPILTDLFAKEGKAASEMVDAPPLEITPAIQASIDKAINLMSKSYNEETMSLLNETLSTSQQEGWSLDQLTEEIKNIYELSDGYRAERVAKTETFRVANDSTKTAWKESGVVKTTKWYTAEDERTCEFCGPLHGKIIDIDSTYFDKGDTVKGSDGGQLDLSYDNIANPPLHVNCRCYIRPEDVSIN